MSYPLLKKSIITFLVVYFLVGIGARFGSQGTENFYPFFSWFLFVEVPPEVQTDFEVLIHEAGEKKFSPAVSLGEAKILNPSRSLNEYYNLARRLGENLEAGRVSEADRLRRNLEGNFTVEPVVYEVTKITYNNIDKFKKGEIISSRPIATFDSRE